MRYLYRAGWILVPVIMLALAGCSSNSNGSGPGDPFDTGGTSGGANQGNSSTAGYSLALLPGKTAALTNEESIVTATLKDSDDRPVANQTVHFSISAGPAIAVTSSVRTDSNGIALAFVKTGATDVTTNVIVQGTASVNNTSVVGYGSFQVSPGNADLISTQLSLSIPSFVARPNEELLVTATAKDSAGNPLANQVVRFNVAALPAVMVTDSATTDSHGIATAIVRAGNPSGIANIIVQAETTVNANQVIAVIPFQIVPATTSTANYAMTLTPSKQVVANYEEFFATAQLKDAAGTPVPNQPVNFTVAAGDASVITDTSSSDSTGNAIARIKSLNPGGTSSVILQASATVEGTLVTALAPVQIVTQPYLPSTLRMELSSDKASVGINSDLLLTATVSNQQATPVPVQNQQVNFSIVAGPGSIIDTSVATDSSGKAYCRLKSGTANSSSSIIVKATSSVFGTIVNAYTSIELVRQNSYVINFLSSKVASDPAGNLNTMSGTVAAGYSGQFTFKQLVPFQVLDNNGVPLPNQDVTIQLFNYGGDSDTVIEVVPPLPGAPVVFPPDLPRVTVRTDDHGMGIFTCNISLDALGPGLTNAESVTYQATTTIAANAANQLPANLELASYGGFVVSLFQEKE